MTSGPTLLRRFPKLRWRPPLPQHIVGLEDQTSYPELEGDFTILDKELMEQFRNADNAAMKQQNTFYLVQMAFATGAVLATILGAVAGAMVAGQPYIGLVEAGLTAFLGAGALIAFSKEAQRAYYTQRLVAERLRSEYFLFLGRVEPYAEPAKRLQTLRQRVKEISV